MTDLGRMSDGDFKRLCEKTDDPRKALDIVHFAYGQFGYDGYYADLIRPILAMVDRLRAKGAG